MPLAARHPSRSHRAGNSHIFVSSRSLPLTGRYESEQKAVDPLAREERVAVGCNSPSPSLPPSMRFPLFVSRKRHMEFK